MLELATDKSSPEPSALLVLVQGTASLGTFQPQFHCSSDKREEGVLFRAQNDIACCSRTWHKAHYITGAHKVK